MRNFYLTANIDGRETQLAGGPRAKDGEMTVEIRQRDNGRSVVAFDVICTEYNGKLTTRIYDQDKYVVAEFVTQR